jgi:vancomycin permeability regulator SanA
MLWFLLFLLTITLPIYFSFKNKIKYWFLVGLVILAPVLFMQLNLLPILNSRSETILVLGAGILSNRYPSLVLKNRLDKSVELFNQGQIKTIIVSGDNPRDDYNEPKVMKDYLVSKGIAETAIKEDFGGRRTADSCYRVKNFFKIDSAIVITQGFHLGRAKFLCQSAGLKTGFVFAQDSGLQTTTWGYIREIVSSWAALNDSVWFRPQVGSDGSEAD